MDRLRKAIDLARRQENYSLTSVLRGEKNSCKKALSINYTHTAQFEADFEELSNNRIIDGNLINPVVDSYKILRTQVIQKFRQENWNTVAVISPRSGCGSTLTAINLAISMACEVNHTVLLVDLNLRDPKISSYLGLYPEHGIDDYLNESSCIEEIFVNPGINRLVILPCRAKMIGSSEYLSSPRLTSLIQELRARYSDRLIIFDMPPLLAADDAMVFMPNIDAALMVAACKKTKKDDVLRSMDLLKSTSVVGWVCNYGDLYSY